MQEKASMMKYFINLCFFLYFIVLFAERAQSVARSMASPSVRLFGDGFNGYAYTLTLASMAGTLLFLIVRQSAFFAGLFTRSGAVYDRIDFVQLTIAAGILLLSGMVHTEFTIAPMQFGAYGAWIVGLALQTVLNGQSAADKPCLWLSFCYLVFFSMAIPVMYRSNIAHAGVFHWIEAAAAVLLVAAFTYMAARIFLGQGQDLFFWLPMILAAVFDAVILAMRWKEQVNSFVLIFLIVTAAAFAVGKIFCAVRLR